MPSRARLLFLLTDGGRARFLERSPQTRCYVTIEETDATAQLTTLRGELRARPPGRSISSTSPRRANVGPEDYLRPAEQASVRKDLTREPNSALGAWLNDIFANP